VIALGAALVTILGARCPAMRNLRRVERNWAEFYEILNRSLPRFNETLQLPFYDTQAMERLPMNQIEHVTRR
jgi:hypothetical protein